MQMGFNVWPIQREAFCWLNEEKVVVLSYVISTNGTVVNKGHCELLNLVSADFFV